MSRCIRPTNGNYSIPLTKGERRNSRNSVSDKMFTFFLQNIFCFELFVDSFTPSLTDASEILTGRGRCKFCQTFGTAIS